MWGQFCKTVRLRPEEWIEDTLTNLGYTYKKAIGCWQKRSGTHYAATVVEIKIDHLLQFQWFTNDINKWSVSEMQQLSISLNKGVVLDDE